MTALALICLFAAEPQEAVSPHMVTVNVKVLEFKDAEVPKELNEEALRKLVASTKPEASKQFQLSTLDKRQAKIQLGDEVAVVSGYTATGRGKIQPIYERDQVGSILVVTPMVEKNHIALDTSIEVSRIIVPPKSTKEPDEAKFTPSQKTLLSMESTLAVQPGKPSFLHIRDQNPKTSRHYVIVISATSKSLD
ncbi:MAG: hypothetical protein AB8G99_00670 [Planctomycetaceae bacterium]